MVSAIEILGPDLETVIDVEPQNPPFPPATPTEAPLLALVDTGVNYLLPAFQDSLAVKSDGGLFGYDFWDNDDRPLTVIHDETRSSPSSWVNCFQRSRCRGAWPANCHLPISSAQNVPLWRDD